MNKQESNTKKKERKIHLSHDPEICTECLPDLNEKQKHFFSDMN